MFDIEPWEFSLEAAAEDLSSVNPWLVTDDASAADLGEFNEFARGHVLNLWRRQSQERAEALYPLGLRLMDFGLLLLKAHPAWAIQGLNHLEHVSLEISARPGASVVTVECRRAEEIEWQGQNVAVLSVIPSLFATSRGVDEWTDIALYMSDALDFGRF